MTKVRYVAIYSVLLTTVIAGSMSGSVGCNRSSSPDDQNKAEVIAPVSELEIVEAELSANGAAANELARKYYVGEEVAQDYAEAAKWYRKAADDGLADAQFNLALMYMEGLGVPQSSVEAYKWFSLAASRFSDGDEEQKKIAIEDRDLIGGLLKPEEKAEAENLIREWKPN